MILAKNGYQAHHELSKRLHRSGRKPGSPGSKLDWNGKEPGQWRYLDQSPRAEGQGRLI